MQIGTGFSATKEVGAVQSPEPLPTLIMKPTKKTNVTRTLPQRPLRPNKGIPSGIDATVGFTLNPPGYDCIYSNLFSGHRCKCIGHALHWRCCCHRLGKCSRISGSTQKASPARKQTPRALAVIALPSTSPEIAEGRRRRVRAGAPCHPWANRRPDVPDPPARP
jgi:hypothetical protein